MKRQAKKSTDAQPLQDALKIGKTAFIFAGVFSLASNILYLSLPIYTNQVFSRVLASHSVPTLLVLTGGIVFVFMISGLLDFFRAQVLNNFATIFDQEIASRTFAALFDKVVNRRGGSHAQPLRDIDTLRAAIGGPTVGLIFDVPFMPIFMIILFYIDPWVGAATLLGGVVLLVLAVLQDRATRALRHESAQATIQSYSYTDAALRNAEVVRAIGMLPTLGAKWASFRSDALASGMRADDTASLYSNAIHTVRMIIQIVIIALGAYLVITGRIPPGVLFANMILSGRALQPLERIVGSWKGLFLAAEAYQRLRELHDEYEQPVPTTQLPIPTGRLTVENVSFAPAGSASLVLNSLNFAIAPGETVGVIGPSGAGKSTLMRLLVGIWQPFGSGAIRLDGANVYTWNREDFGRYVAYQPQDTELFAGTVRDNIARFRSDARDEDIVAAAKAAGAHELILRLPKGYDSELGEGGSVLSAGQRQRVALARTLYGDPVLVVLDEPNANLDSDGEAALQEALKGLKARGATVIIVSHKALALSHADKVLVLQQGVAVKFGPAAEVLGQMRSAQAQAQAQSQAQSQAQAGRVSLVEVKS